MLAETNTFVKQIAKLVVKKTENGFRDMIRGRENFCSSGFLREGNADRPEDPALSFPVWIKPRRVAAKGGKNSYLLHISFIAEG